MSEFIQLHLLVSYPPSNLNRDDLGRPKTAVVGGKQRLRISSQSLKRAWRTSDIFVSHVDGSIGVRTRELGEFIRDALKGGFSLHDLVYGSGDPSKVREKVPAADAEIWAKKFVQVIKNEKKKKNKTKDATESDVSSDQKKESDESLQIDQLTHFAPEEIQRIDSVLEAIAGGQNVSDEDLSFFTKQQSAVDIAMFGRMLASIPQYSVEAAVQVAHAFTVNQVVIEDDYFTAVDDLNRGIEDMGAGHLGEVEFGSGVFYLYICINRSLLVENLDTNSSLASTALKGLIEAAAKVGPSGKQNSFASRAYASYILAEKGTQQPRSLSVAYLKPIRGDAMMEDAIMALLETRSKFETVYGSCADKIYEINSLTGKGTLDGLFSFVADPHV